MPHALKSRQDVLKWSHRSTLQSVVLVLVSMRLWCITPAPPLLPALAAQSSSAITFVISSVFVIGLVLRLVVLSGETIGVV
jgi:hypothetical protein